MAGAGPQVHRDRQAGAAPIADPAVFAAFHGKEGVNRIVARMVELAQADPRISGIFKPFAMQNRLLAKLAPMKRDIVAP